ncbi:D-alanyl-D-alanine carboxypeptidase/D-alanyl-D-alanine endopeptidase [Shewanella gaetbuli]
MAFVQKCLLATAVFCLSTSVKSAITESPKTSVQPNADQQHVASIVNFINPAHSLIALSIWDIEDKRLVYQQNANMLMNPASVMKILTALVSAEVLGKNFTYTTRLSTDGEIQLTNSTLTNDIYLQFSGDPTLTYADLSKLIKRLKKQGVNQVSGNIYLIGDTLSNDQPAGWVWDDLNICYAAPVSSFIIDKNCVKARLSASGHNKKTQLKVMGKRPIKVDNNTQFATYSASNAECDLNLKRKDNNHYTLTGCYDRAKSLPLSIAINDPVDYALKVINNIFEQQKITLQGQTIAQNNLLSTNDLSHAPQLITQATHSSASLNVIMKEMLLDSDNLMAEALLKTSAEYYYGEAANLNKAAQTLRTVLNQLGIDLGAANIADGSGLSRYNMLSAAHVLNTLKFIVEHEEYHYILDNLPLSGRTGTLQYKRYFNRAPLKNKVIAKTGSMLGVSNLAGQFEASNGKKYIFVVFENGLSPKIKKEQKASYSALLLQKLMDMPLVIEPNQ